MNAKKILMLRDYWYYNAIGESHRETAKIARDTSAALDIVLKSKSSVRELKNEVANIRSKRA